MDVPANIKFSSTGRKELRRSKRMREVAVLGIGMHPWGKFPEESFIDLGVTAIDNALEDANLAWRDIPSAVSGVWQWGD